MHIHTIQLNIERLMGGTRHMDATEFGAYMSLLICCYETKNNLPDDDKRLARMARVTLKVWRRIKNIVLEKFTKSGSRWYHEGVQKELDKYKRLSTKNRANALKRHNTDQPVAKRPQSQTDANINNNNLVTSNSKNPPISPKGEYEKNFLDIWEIWPRKRRGNKSKAYSAYKSALRRDSEDSINRGVQAYIDSEEAKGDYAKGCAAWFNDDRWTNDYSDTKGKTDGKSKTDRELEEWLECNRNGNAGKGIDVLLQKL